MTKSPDAASPHAINSDEFVTVAPSECAALVLPLTALVIPVKSIPETPVYDISSVPT